MLNGIVFIGKTFVRLKIVGEIMNTYKVIFAKNNVISCDLLSGQLMLKDGYYYEHRKGQLIYALINAASEQEALTSARRIVKDVTEKTFGVDFIH